MNLKIVFAGLIIIEAILLFLLLTSGANFELLNSQGSIAREQRNLGFLTLGILLVVAIPLLTAFYFVVFRFHSSKSKYNPDAHHSRIFEIGWWVVPGFAILVLSIVTWQRTHALDPYRPLEANHDAIKIQVIALNWKWLFIYPEQNIASVNFVQFPEDTPIDFELTAQAPMNSFWIPSLGGQIYAMTGMSTKLHLIADNKGDYRGQAGEINGSGFSGMTFTARASSREEFDDWVLEIKGEEKVLDRMKYEKLAVPSVNNEVEFFSSTEEGLYNNIIMKFMSENNSNPHN